MSVSCLCLTYGRPHLLEEAIESFLRQTWEGKKELIVLNDHPDQTLSLDHPEITVVNVPRRLRSLGEKRNLSVSLAQYDNLFVWDDDDIYLPWRIEETMKTLPKKHFFKCPRAWLMNDGKIAAEPSFNLFHGGSAYTRWLWEQVRGYKAMNGGEDAEIEARFQEIGKNKQHWPHTELPNNKLYYIYRWSHGSYHTTGHTSLNGINPQVIKGEIILKPHWKLPYDELAFVAAGDKVEKSNSLINFIVFSKNRPLQLDGYLRSLEFACGKQEVHVLYTCEEDYEDAYNEVKEKHKWVKFKKESNFHFDLTTMFTGSEFTCFGCDDVVFTGKFDIEKIAEVMRRDDTFAFSLRLGKNISRSMFGGNVKLPFYTEDNGIMTWDLHKSHGNGDFGYSWEMDGTVYPTRIACAVVNDVKATSPNILEANGGGTWSSKTPKKMMACFSESKLVVPTVNVVQKNFPNPIVGKSVDTCFLLEAWYNNMRLDIQRYQTLKTDCIHIGDLFLSNT